MTIDEQFGCLMEEVDALIEQQLENEEREKQRRRKAEIIRGGQPNERRS